MEVLFWGDQQPLTQMGTNEDTGSFIPLLPVCSCGRDLLSLHSGTSLSGMGLLFWNRKFKWTIAVRCCQRALLTGERSHTIWQVKGISFIPDLEIYHNTDCSFQWLHWLNFRVLGWGQAAASFTPQNGCHYSDGLSLCLTTPQGIKELVWCIWTESSEDL